MMNLALQQRREKLVTAMPWPVAWKRLAKEIKGGHRRGRRLSSRQSSGRGGSRSGGCSGGHGGSKVDGGGGSLGKVWSWQAW